MQIELHEYQARVFCSNALVVCAVAGIQSGKTTCGAVWLRRKISEFNSRRDTFIVAAPSYKILQSSTIPAFLEHNHELGHYNKSDSEFILRHGAKIFFRSMENEWSVEGVTRCRGIWLDEGGLISDQGWINLTGRASPMQAQILITSTPYRTFGFYYDLYQAWKNNDRDDVDIVQWRSIDNPYFPKSEYYRQQRLLDRRMFRLRYEGVFEKLSGLVYPDFDSGNIVDPFKLDRSRFLILGGADWGTVHPFAAVIRAISRAHQGKYEDYQIAERLVTGLTADEQISEVYRLHQRYGMDGWVCDSAGEGMASLARSKGIPMVGVQKGGGSVAFGIGLHGEIIRTREHKLFRGLCDETCREYETYSYKPHVEGRETSDKPVKVKDDLMDASRYVSMHYRYLKERTDKILPDHKTHLQALLSGDYHTHESVYADGLD